MTHATCVRLFLYCLQGLSGRPAFTASDRASAEDFFLESLNAWRAKQGLQKFILVGHSLGGYLAASYALRHPEQVQHLVLVGPAGIVSMEVYPLVAGLAQHTSTCTERLVVTTRSRVFMCVACGWPV
jgi:pimeloyl-ACP methyl ester carboxylesterase